MISFIVCSIHPDEAQRLANNIQQTVGVQHEVIIEDNRDGLRGICKVYNDGAKRARYEHLCFVHEDVVFIGEEWGKAIEEKLTEPHTGVIGFMGTTYKSKSPSGWNVMPSLNRSHFIQTLNGTRRYSSEMTEDFSPPCVVLDGACLFIRAEVWQKHPFDPVLCPTFHGYDLDFCLQVLHAGFQNYVCGTCWIEHFSAGSFNKEWAETILALHQRKWKDVLPIGGNGLNTYIEARAYYVFLKSVRHLPWTLKEKTALLRLIPYRWKHPVTALKSFLLML